MAATVAVLGATGVYGRHLVPRLVARGHRVRALVRRPEAATIAAACGADVRAADVFDAASLRAGLEGCEVGINLATALPRPERPRRLRLNDRVRREGTPIWLRACREAGVTRVVQQSVAMVNASGGEAWSDEDTVFAPGGDDIAARAIAAARDMEETVRRSDLDWLVLRGALFYGPGTGFDDDWLARARAGKLRLPGDGSGWVSLVHITDMAAATVAAVERWPSRRALIVADDRPVLAELFAWVALAARRRRSPGTARPPLLPCRQPARARGAVVVAVLRGLPRRARALTRSRGGCYCGRIRYEAASVFDVVYCHCTICRRISGAPVYAGIAVPKGDFRVVSGEPTSFASSDHGMRWFCPICGTQLQCTDSQSDYVGVPIGTLDEPGSSVRPQIHQWTELAARLVRDRRRPAARRPGGALPHPAKRG